MKSFFYLMHREARKEKVDRDTKPSVISHLKQFIVDFCCAR